MKNLVLFLCAGFLIVACSSNEPKKGEIVSTIVAGGQSEAELKKELEAFQKEEQKRIEDEKKGSTSLKFDKLRHDFGDVKPETDNICKFKVTNTGENPLIIADVSASCGCTMPHKPDGPIAPGKSDYIEVKFHPKPGQVNEIIKTVTVTANTVPRVSEISIRAFVK